MFVGFLNLVLLIGVVCVGWIVDVVGWRWIMVIVVLFFFVGVGIMGVVLYFFLLMIGWLLEGIGVGFVFMIVLVYMVEVVFVSS